MKCVCASCILFLVLCYVNGKEERLQILVNGLFFGHDSKDWSMNRISEISMVL